MRFISLIFSIVFCFVQINAQTALAQITEVTVFQGAAELHQKANVYLSKGRNIITIDNIPSSIIKNTLNISSNAGVYISAYDHKSLMASDSKYKMTIANMEDSLVDIEIQLKQLSGEIEVFNQEWALITENNIRIGTDGGLDGIDLEEAADFYRQRLSAIKDQMLQIERGVTAQTKLKKSIEKRLKKLKYDQKKVGVIELVINASANQNIELNIQYLTKNAGWNPSYKINYLNENKSLILDYDGMVYNNTGVEWDAVQMTLITGYPRADLVAPKLDLYRLTTFNFKNSSSRNQPINQSMDKAPQALYEEISLQDDSYPISVSKEESGAWTAFKIQGEQFIPSDKKSYIIPINKIELSASYYYLCIPKIEAEAYHMAKVSEWENLRLLPGRANVYNNNKYVGNIMIDPNTVEDHILIPLGTDSRIVISREVNKTYTSSRIIGANMRRSFAFEIMVQNNRNDSIDIIIQDQIPVSTQSNIEVDFDSKTSGKLNPLNGKITWQKLLPAASSHKVEVGYIVKYPKDLRINL